MSKTIGYLICVAVVLGVCGASWGQLKATNPDPPDGALAVLIPLVQWTPGTTALLHDVYFGTDPDLGPDDLVQASSSLTMYYHVPGLVPGTTYYWRVDEIDKDGVTIHTGDVWTFTAQAMTAYHPTPADGSTVAPLAPDLTWLAGQGAQKHHVYFSDSEAAVTDGTADADKGIVDDPNYAPGELQPISMYYWRVDEVGPGDTELAGEVWSFTTVLSIDDFESYDDADNRIYETWLDGAVNGTGSYVGYPVAENGTFGETVIVHSGGQSMPLDYNNTEPPYYSEAERTWTAPQDWAASGVDMLTLYVQGLGADFLIPQVTTPPVIDGEMEEVWSAASVQPIKTTIAGEEPDGPADASGQFRVLYDIENLYALIDVNDDVFYNDTANSWQDDSVEFYVDADNTKAGPGLTGNARQYTFGWTTEDVQGTNTNITGIEHAQVDTATGWRIEIKFPWQSLMSTDAPVGQLVGIDCFINDDDDGSDTRESQVAWHSLAGGDWETAASWGTALVAEPIAADGADVVYVAVQDTSNQTAIIAHPDPGLAQAMDWVEWKIALSEFADIGVNLAAVKKMVVGVGDPDNPVQGGAGLIFVDDIYLTLPAPEPPAPAGPALVAYYPFENNVEDGSGSGLHGTAVGEPGYAEGLAGLGMAMDFDGTDDVVELGEIDVVGQITLAAWVRPDSFAINDARIISKANEWSGDNHWWMVSTISETSLRFRLKTDDGEGTATLISDPVLEAGAWAHVAATWDGSMMRIYKDGVEVAGQEKGGSAVAVDPAVGAAIGSQPSDAFDTDPSHVVKFFAGLIDEVRIYDGALSAEEIVELAGM